MRDQQRYATNFSQKIGLHNVTMQLIGEQQIMIKVQDTYSMQKYKKIISSISDHDYFQQPMDIYNYITNHSQKVLVQNNVLRINYEFGAKKKTKIYEIQLQKELCKQQQSKREIQRLNSKISIIQNYNEEITNLFKNKTQQMKEQMNKMMDRFYNDFDAMKKQNLEVKQSARLAIKLAQQLGHQMKSSKLQDQLIIKNLKNQMIKNNEQIKKQFQMIDSIKKSMESMGYKNIQNNKKVDETHSRCENLNKKIQDMSKNMGDKVQNNSKIILQLNMKLNESSKQVKLLKISIDNITKSNEYSKNIIDNIRIENTKQRQQNKQIINNLNKIILQNKLLLQNEFKQLIKKSNYQYVLYINKIQQQYNLQTININKIQQRLQLQRNNTIKQLSNIKEELISSIKDINLKNINYFNHHTSNPHRHFFTVDKINNKQSRIISKYQQKGWLGFSTSPHINYINLPSIDYYSKIKYRFKIIKSKNNDIIFGLCTQKAFGVKDAFNQEQSVYYSCWNSGYLYECGVGRQLVESGCQINDQIEMNLDLVTFKIEWKNNNKLIAECNVPNNIRGKPIFLSILLACKDDEVEMKID